MPKPLSPVEALPVVEATFGVREWSSVVELKGTSARWVKRRPPSEALSCWTLFSPAPSGRRLRTWTMYPTWRSSKVCLLCSRHVSACFLLFAQLLPRTPVPSRTCHLCTSAGKPKHKKAMELAPAIARTKGCHETALYIGLLPLTLGIPPHSLDTRAGRIQYVRLPHAAQDPDNEHDPFRHCM